MSDRMHVKVLLGCSKCVLVAVAPAVRGVRGLSRQVSGSLEAALLHRGLLAWRNHG